MSIENALESLKREEKKEITSLTERREVSDEYNSLNLEKNSRGNGWKSSLDNLIKILEGDSRLKESLQYNEFTNEIDIVKPLILNGNHKMKGFADDMLVKQIRIYISRKYKIDFKKSDLIDGLEVVAMNNKYNPLKIYLLDCASKRARSPSKRDPFDILRYYLNVEDNEYNRIIFDLFFRGAVAKVFEPSIKFDFVLDLTGQQGVGKTQFFENLFTDQYFTTVETFTDRDDKARMVRNWCVFDDEMVATKKATFSELKKFITERKIEFRPPYASTDRRLFKNFVIVRATNEQEYLNDLTGGRRFLIAKVHKNLDYKDRNWTNEDREAFWGGMVEAWKNNKQLTLTEQEEKLINTEREEYKVTDEEVEDLYRYLNTPYPSKMYNAPLSDKVRKHYIHSILNNGDWLDGNGNKTRLDFKKYGELIERDRLTVNLFFQEVYLNENPSPKQKKKIRITMQNMEGWGASKSIKFGKTVKSGFKKINR